jgi:glutaredoxin-related protein
LRWLQVVKENKIVLFMKGNKDFPLCGFSGPCGSRLGD